MAHCIPTVLPPRGVTPGEKDVFQLLKSMRDEWIIYFEPCVQNRFPDFVVIAPDAGVCVIEVKDWRIGKIVDLDKEVATLAVSGGHKQVSNPIVQVNQYIVSLARSLRKTKYVDCLRKGNGFSFNTMPLVILRNITRDQLDERGWSQFLPREYVLTSDDFGVFRTAFSQNLKRHMTNGADCCLTDEQVALIRSVVRPECVVQDDGVHLAMLDLEQEDLASRRFGGHRLVFGPAGSGKTVILIARARLLAKQGKRCLVLCYNRPLADWLEAKLPEKEIKVRTFHSFACFYQFDFTNYKKTPEKLGFELLAHLNSNPEKVEKYDAVLVDEIQDFDRSWVRCAMQSLRHQSEGDLFLAGDGEQSPRKSLKVSYRSLGINVAGRRSKNLSKVYRNTEQIWEASCALNSEADGEFDSEDALGKGSKKIVAPERTGPQVEVEYLQSEIEERHYAVEQVRMWLRKGIRPRDIAVLFPWRDIADELADRVPHETTLLTIQRCKGLQWRYVIVLHADKLHKNKFDSGGNARQWLQIAMRRATYSLTILSSGPCELVDRIERHVKKPKYKRQEMMAR